MVVDTSSEVVEARSKYDNIFQVFRELAAQIPIPRQKILWG